MNFPLYIAKRYLLSKSKSSAITIITRIASLGIIAGALALFVVLSVFSGLKEFSLSFSNDFDPDIKVFPKTGKSFTISPTQQKQLLRVKEIENYSRVVEERALFYFDGKEMVTFLKGVDVNYPKTNAIATKLFNGEWLSPYTPEVVVGYGITQKLSLGLNDFNNPLEVYMPKKGKEIIQSESDAFQKATLLPVGIYAISDELDSKYVFCDLKLAQNLLEFQPNQLTALEIKMKPDADENKLMAQLDVIFSDTVVIKNRAQQNDTLYKMLNTENLAVYLIFTLVIIIALFNLVGALIMMILEKKNNLKTMMHLGAELNGLKRIFLLQGTLLSIIGGIIGIVLGVIVVYIQQTFNVIMITETLPYPVVLSFENVVIVFVTIFVLGYLASWLASTRVSQKLLN